MSSLNFILFCDGTLTDNFLFILLVLSLDFGVLCEVFDSLLARVLTVVLDVMVLLTEGVLGIASKSACFDVFCPVFSPHEVYCFFSSDLCLF